MKTTKLWWMQHGGAEPEKIFSHRSTPTPLKTWFRYYVIMLFPFWMLEESKTQTIVTTPLPLHTNSPTAWLSVKLYCRLFLLSTKWVSIRIISDIFQIQVWSHSWASKPVTDPTTMWIHFHPDFKWKTVSDCSSVQNGIFSSKSQLEWCCPSQDKTRNARTISPPAFSSIIQRRSSDTDF